MKTDLEVKALCDQVRQQDEIRVYDEDSVLFGDYFADIMVGGWLILELKAVKALAPEHTAQIMGYMKSARLKHGPLINFGFLSFRDQKIRPASVSKPHEPEESESASVLLVLFLVPLVVQSVGLRQRSRHIDLPSASHCSWKSVLG